MDALLVTALIMCVSGDAHCWSDDSQEVKQIHVCGVAPDRPTLKPTIFGGRFRGENYVVTVKAACESA